MQGIAASAYVGSNGLFDVATVNAYRDSIKGLSRVQAELALSSNGLSAAQIKQILTSKESTTAFNLLTKSIWANIKAIAKWLVTTPTGWITLAIGATVGLVAAYNNVEKKQNELIESARKLQEEYRSFSRDTASKITSLSNQADEFEELSKGVDKYGNNISLASDEYDRYKSIVTEILGHSPELIQGYDAEGNAIADKNGLLERSIELLKEEQRLKLKEMTTDEKTGKAYDAAEAGWQQVQGYEGANTRNEIARWFDDNALRGGVNYEVDIAKVLGIKDEWKEEGNNLKNAIINNIDTVVKNIKDKKEELLAISDSDGNAIFSVDEIDNMIDLSNDWQYAYNQWQQDIEDAKHGMDDQFDLYAQRAKSYNDLTDAQKVFVNEYIRATGDITDAEGYLLYEDKILEKAKGYEKFVNEFAELNKLGEGGSVDLTFRPEIDTEELNKKGWEAGEGFATVFSSAISNTDFDDLIPKNAEDTVAINFTPIIVDPNTGEFKGVLSEEELYAYAHDILSGVREDDLNLQIGAKFEGKNAIDEAVADGERIHYLHEKLFINNDTVDSWEELRKVLVKTGDDAVQAGKNANEMTVSLSDLEKVSDNIKTLGSAFKELYDDGYITIKTLNEIKTASGLSAEEWEKYEKVLLGAKEGSAEFNQAMSDLTYGMLDNVFAGTDLSDMSEEYVSSVLEENGVLNASAVAHDYLKRKKAELKAESLLSKIKEDDFAGSLQSVADECGLTTSAIADMMLKMIMLNNQKLDLSQQIDEIVRLREAMNLSGNVDGSSLGIVAKQGTVGTGYSYNGKWYNSWNEAYRDALADNSSKEFAKNNTPVIPEYNPSGKSPKDLAEEHLEKARDYAEKVADIQEDLAEKEEDFAEKMADAWKEEHLEQLKDGLEKQKDIIDRYKKNVEVIDFGLEHIETDDFTNRADLLSDKFNKLTSYGSAMRAEFDRVANIIPQTADEATELANRLEELGSDMRDNATAVRETVTSLQMLNIEVASTLVDDRMSELQSELDNIDRRIEILNSDYKDDYGAALDVMSMDMLLPVYSEFDKKRREKQRSDKALIKVEQETQDKINEIVTKSLEMQSQENAAAREKERQELIKDMEKARKDAQKKLAEAHQDYLDFLKDNKIATTKGVQEITDAFAKADVKLPEIDITSVEEAIKKIRDKFKDFFSNGSIEFNPNINSGGGSGGGLNGIGGAVIPASNNNITSNYGYRIHPIFKDNRLHRGTDFSVAEGSPIYAYSDGVVTTATYNSSYGNYVKIDHGDGRETLYAHASKLNTSVGAQVKRGQKIAESGNTGNSTGPHLHFEYIKDGKATDPKYIFPAFASGTPKGNRLSSSLGIAGENYKPEILIDKATGKATYIDEPTVIDTSTTDVVGEKQTAKIPKFADGTKIDDPFSIDKIEKFYDDAVDSISNIEKNIIAEVQNILNDDALSDFERAQALGKLKYEAGLKASEEGKRIYNDLLWSYNEWIKSVENRTADWSLEIYNAYKDAFANVSDLTYDMVNEGIEGIQSAAEMRWENSNNWISDRNFYNDWDLFDDSEVDAWERVVKWLKAEYPNELDKIKQAEQNLFTARKKEAEKSISDIEDYIKARNTYNDWDVYNDNEVKAVLRITKIIEDEYEQRLISYDEYIDKLEEQSERIYSLGQSRVDKHLSDIDKYINARNLYNDWDDFGDTETEAIQRQLEILKQAYNLKLISYEEYTEKFAEYTQKLYSVAKDNIIEEISELIEDYEEMKNLESSQLDSQKTLLQSYYDVTNAIADAQHEINKELRASMTMYEYLNEETRKLLFNQEDYEVLSKELLDIQTAANELQKQYEEDILNASAETIAEITSQYQMQYETMMKKYEITKAELEVAKKRQQLDNVLAERNTRMFINGQWQWVAKTQDVINAQNELADAEINKKKQEASLEQTEAINEFTSQINSIGTDLSQVRKYWEDMQEMLNDESDEVAKALKMISEVSSPELQRVISTTGGSIGSFSIFLSGSTAVMSDIISGDRGLGTMSTSLGDIITDLQNYSGAIQALTLKIGGTVNTSSSGKSSSASNSTQYIIEQMQANSEKWFTASEDERKDLHDLNDKLGDLIDADYDPKTGKWYSSDGKVLYSVNKHADGTRYTPGGLTALGEEGFEAYITDKGRLIPIAQPTVGNIGAGGVVFNREQMANLRTLWDWSNIGKISPFVSSPNANSQSTVIDNSIHINGLTVGEQGNEDWINGLRRYVATHK